MICYDLNMWNICKKNLVYLFKYSDTHLYEFGLSVLLLALNPFHLLQLKHCDDIQDFSFYSLIIGTVVVGICFIFGVLLNRLDLRFQMARIYWAYTIFTLLTLAPCGKHEIGLVVSFTLQFFSAIFLLWRLGTERDHRLRREKEYGELQ